MDVFILYINVALAYFIDASGNTEVITTGYSSRTYVKQAQTTERVIKAYRITPKQIVCITKQPQNVTVAPGTDAQVTVQITAAAIPSKSPA